MKILFPIPKPPTAVIAPVSVEIASVLFCVKITSSVTIWVVVTVVNSIVNFCATISPPTYKLPPIPAPPITVRAAFEVLTACVLSVIATAPENAAEVAVNDEIVECPLTSRAPFKVVVPVPTVNVLLPVISTFSLNCVVPSTCN